MNESIVPYLSKRIPRLMAFLFDVIPITIVTATLFYFFSEFGETFRAYWANPQDEELRAHFLDQRNTVRDFAGLFFVIYSGIMESTPWQGTLGKRLLGLSVVDMNGRRLSLRRSMMRNIFQDLLDHPGSNWLSFCFLYAVSPNAA